MSVENTQKSIGGDAVARTEKEFNVDEKHDVHDLGVGDMIDTSGKLSHAHGARQNL